MTNNFTEQSRAIALQPHATQRDIRQLLALNPFHMLSDLACRSSGQLLKMGFSEPFVLALKQPNQSVIEKHLRWLDSPDHHYVSIYDPLYPAQLKLIADPPLGLFVAGEVGLLNGFQIALVGARKASPNGLSFAKKLATDLCQAGLVVTSGLALGIDGAAHRGTLAYHKATLAVIGSGLNRLYPSGHIELAKQLRLQGGAIVSEYLLDTPPKRMHFPSRNRLIAGLSLGVCVVEAALKSGSLITADLALKYDREVFAVPGSPLNAFAKGCNRLIQSGAKLIEGADEILCELPFLMQTNIASSRQARDNSGESGGSEQKTAALLHSIAYEPTAIDKIVSLSGLSVAEVNSLLSTLELSGQIVAVSNGFMRVA